MITANLLAAPGVPGDYNGNGNVDAADYVLWRNGGPLQNEVDDCPASVTPEDYDEWRPRFGNPAAARGCDRGAGAGSGRSRCGHAAVRRPCHSGCEKSKSSWTGGGQAARIAVA